MSKPSEQNADSARGPEHSNASSSRSSSTRSHRHHTSSGSSHGSSSHGSSSHSSSSHGSSYHSSSYHSSSHASSDHAHTSSGSSHHTSDSHHSSEHHHHHVSENEERRDALIQKYTFVAEDETPQESEKHHRHHHHSRRFSRRRTIKRVLIALVSIPLALVLIAASVFGVLNLIGKKQLQKDTGGVQSKLPSAITYDEGKTVEYNGRTYVLNENIVTVAAIGMDRESFGLDDDKIGTAGQADFILIVTMDLKTGVVSSVMIPRDTMVDVDQYTTDGQYVGSKNMQICLSFAYGDGGETSSRNVLTSAQRVLYGVPVHLYGVLDLDGIPALNDAIGGVSVTLQENFGGSYAGDRITLHGAQAETFVRSRDTSRMDSDTPRRARQIQYVQAYVDKAIHAAIRDLGVIRRLYNTAMQYAFTNVSLAKVTYIATTLLSKGVSVGEVQTLAGTLQPGDPYAEYTLDEKAAFETVLNVFYTPLLAE